MSDLDASGAGLGVPDEVVEDPCAANNSNEMFGLRVGGIFIILVSVHDLNDHRAHTAILASGIRKGISVFDAESR